MSRHELYDPQCWDAGGRVFLLEIAGIGDGDDPVRYYSGPVAPPTKTDSGSGKDYIDVEAIVGVSPLTESVRPGGGVATYSAVVVSLARNRDNPGRFDPGVILRRGGHRFGAFARLDRALASDDSAGQVVYLDRNHSTLGTFPGHVAIGGESVWATAGAGDGSAGNPWRLTGVTRAIRGTLPLAHHLGGAVAVRPYVKREVTTWKRRRAILYAAHRRLDGSLGDFAEVIRGYLTGAPRITEAVVEVSVMPLAGLLDAKITTSALAVGLHPRKHCIEGSAAHTMAHGQLWQRGAVFETHAQGDTNAGIEPIAVHTTQSHEDAFDVTLAAASPGHPRSGPLWFYGSNLGLNLRPWGLGPTGYVGGFEFADANQAQGVKNTERIVNDQCREAHVVSFITPQVRDETAVLTWPDDYLDAISGASGSGWRKGQRDGLAGAWADIEVVGFDADVGAHLRVKFNPTSGGDDLQALGAMELHFEAGGFWLGAFADWSSGAPARPPTFPAALYYPIWLGPEDVPPGDTAFRRIVEVRPPGSVGRQGKIPIRICRGGWHQRGERYITVSAEMLTTAGGDLPIRIEYTDPADGSRKVHRARVIAVTEPEADVWRLELDEISRITTPSFGDWAGLDPVVITPDVAIEPQPPGKALLRLLTSIGGNEIASNGFDSLPVGAGLLLADCDQSSFYRVDAPPGLERWSPVLPAKGATVAELAEPILRALGVALVMRRNLAGYCRVTLVPVGAPTTVESVATALTDDDWRLDAPPDGDIDDSEIVTARTYETDHADAGEGDPLLTVTVTDAGSIGAHGAQDSETLALRGVHLRDGGTPATLSTLLGVDARLAQVSGYARVRWLASTGTPAGWLLHAGAVVSVTSDYLAGFSDEVGVTDTLARVASMRLSLWDDGCDLVLDHYGNKSTGWNLALRVVDAPAVDEVEVDVAGVWAPSEHPVTGEALDPLSYVLAGHVVDAVPWGDHDSRVALTVVSVDTGTRVITLSGAHGLTGPNWGRIVWTVYDTSPAVARTLAYLADDNDTLGAAPDDGFELV